MSGNPEKPPIVPDNAAGNQEYPPPPAQPNDADMPPAYTTEDAASFQPPPEKAPLPQAQPEVVAPEHHAPHRANTDEAAAFYKTAQDDEGPPPPLPGPRPSQQQSGAGAIPAYDPSNPQFASPAFQSGQASSSAQQQQQQQQYQEAPLAEHQSSHRNWTAMLSDMGTKVAGPINALANKLGSQSFLPTTLDKECYKAGQILRSFCKDGITSDVEAATADPKAEASGSTTPPKQKEPRGRSAIVKIPSKVIAKAQGLAIFTTARVGFNFSGATGSGILIARLPDGSWSPPSGIQVHALGAGFMVGMDIYDCVCVINSKEALSAFKDTRVSLGPDVAVTAGPWGAGGHVDVGSTFQSDVERRAAIEAEKAQKQQQANDHVYDQKPDPDAPAPADDEKSRLRPGKGRERSSSSRSNSSMSKPVFSYVKSRGFYAGMTVDGTMIVERKDANAAFYGRRVTVEEILRGEVPAQHGAGWPAGVQPLYEALRVAEAQQPLPEVNVPAPAAPPAGQHPAGDVKPAGDELPAYQDDGVQRPLADDKVHYA